MLENRFLVLARRFGGDDVRISIKPRKSGAIFFFAVE
jgi:hypothetical protein